MPSFALLLSRQTCVEDGGAPAGMLATATMSSWVARPLQASLVTLPGNPILSRPFSLSLVLSLYCGATQRKVAGGGGGGEVRSRRWREGSGGGGEEWIRRRYSTR
jgi:hypothetical protein